jgi:hypothetical protein
MSMVDRKCRCGVTFQARSADVKRGWGRFCSKRCKAIEQEGRTGQNARHRQGMRSVGAMSQAEMACGGYGDATHDSPFGADKW